MVSSDSFQKTSGFKYRGFMLDTVRHYSSVREILRILDQMHRLKINFFHWHLSNDQGYRLESRKFPKLNEISSWRRTDALDPLVEQGICKEGDRYGGFYTFDEIKQIIDYADKLGIQVVPEIEMPGHASAILAAYPEFSCDGAETPVANTFGIHDRVFCPGKEGTFAFLEELLEEVCGLFPGEYVHIGGDETPKASWKKCPECGKVMQTQGFTDYEQLQSYFINRIIAFLRGKGKKAIVWNEAAYDGSLDPDAIIQYWCEMAPGDSYMPKEFSKGRKIILSNQNPFYCDYSYADTPMRAFLMYKPNVKGIPVPSENILGVEAALWTEWLPTAEQREKMLFPRLLAFSEYAVSQGKNCEDFLSRAKDFDFGNEVSVMPWNEAEPDKETALKEIAANMLKLSERHHRMAEKEGRQVNGNVHETTSDVDPAVQIYLYMKEKMFPAYTEEDVKKVLYYLSQMRK